MIKKIIGIVVALAAIVVIVLAAMHGDRFSSLVFDQGEPAASVEASAETQVQEPSAATQVQTAAEVVPDSADTVPRPDSVLLRDAPKR